MPTGESTAGAGAATAAACQEVELRGVRYALGRHAAARAYAAGTRAAAGRARRRPRPCRAPRRPRPRGSRPTGPPPKRCTIACGIEWSRRSSPSSSTSNTSSPARANSPVIAPSCRTSAKSRTLRSSRFAMRGCLANVGRSRWRPVRRGAPRGCRRPPDDAGEVVDRVVVEAWREPEPLAQRQGDPPGPGRGGDEREPRQSSRIEERAVGARAPRRARSPRAPGRALLDGTWHAVDLVDEQHVAVAEVREDRGEVARPVESGPAGGLEPGSHRVGHDLGWRGLAEPRRSAEQQMVDRLSRRRAPSISSCSCSLTRSCRRSRGRVGRNAMSNSRSSGRRRRPRSRDRRPRYRPTFCSASRSRSSTSRPSPSTSRVASAAS